MFYPKAAAMATEEEETKGLRAEPMGPGGSP